MEYVYNTLTRLVSPSSIYFDKNLFLPCAFIAHDDNFLFFCFELAGKIKQKKKDGWEEAKGEIQLCTQARWYSRCHVDMFSCNFKHSPAEFEYRRIFAFACQKGLPLPGGSRSRWVPVLLSDFLRCCYSIRHSSNEACLEKKPASEILRFKNLLFEVQCEAVLLLLLHLHLPPTLPSALSPCHMHTQTLSPTHIHTHTLPPPSSFEMKGFVY